MSAEGLIGLYPLELLQRFTSEGHARWGKVQTVWSYRGDCTETGDRRLEREMGREAYQHYHYDTVATTGKVLVWLPRLRHPGAVEGQGPGIPADYYWAMEQVSERHPDVVPASKRTLDNVHPDAMESLIVLPGFEIVDVKGVHYNCSSGNRIVKKTTSPPANVVFFRFAHGAGAIAGLYKRKA